MPLPRENKREAIVEGAARRSRRLRKGGVVSFYFRAIRIGSHAPGNLDEPALNLARAAVYNSDNDRIPHTSRRTSPEAPANSRQSPQPQRRKSLLTPGIPAYPRSVRKRHDRPVTPDVVRHGPPKRSRA
jgi:hypothetical protein